MDDASAVLERRYRRLCALYPAAYRIRWADEMVATLVEDAGPGRRTPRVADVADLVASGLRCRLGVASIAGFEGGLSVAAPVALAFAAGISIFAWWRVEPLSSGAFLGGAPLWGHFRTLGPLAYAAWILAALGRAILPPRASRALMGAAVIVTTVIPLLSPLTEVDRPPLWVLMALIVFGLLALAGTAPAVGTAPADGDRTSRRGRFDQLG